MIRTLCRRLPLLLPLILAAALAAALTAAVAHAQSTPGTKWRVVTTLNGMGMSLPNQTTEICSTGDKQDQPAPPSRNGECSYSEVSHLGSTIKYTMHCAGKEPMDGQGEINYGPGHYTGKITVKMARGEMDMNFEGTKLGACTGNEANGAASKSRVQAMQNQFNQQSEQAKQAMAQSCNAEAEAAGSPYGFFDAFKTGTTRCADPAMKRTYCEHFQAYKPFMSQQDTEKSLARSGVATPMGTPFSDSLKLCGLSADAVQGKLCASAEKDDSFEFLTRQCPTQVKTIAARECAGRSYTTASAKYRGLCATYANGGNANGQTGSATAQSGTAQSGPQTNSDEPPKEGLKDKAKNALKGLFGH
jgi:hypothetical protein